jgi:hypothetical protein
MTHPELLEVRNQLNSRNIHFSGYPSDVLARFPTSLNLVCNLGGHQLNSTAANRGFRARAVTVLNWLVFAFALQFVALLTAVKVSFVSNIVSNTTHSALAVGGLNSNHYTKNKLIKVF